MAELELEIDFSGRVFFLEFVEYINFTVSHSGACLLRTPTRTSTCVNAFLLVPLIPPCPHVLCAGSKLIIHPVHPERAAASLAGAGAPRSPIRLVWALAQPRRSHCLRATGPRATLSRAADDPGLLGHLLFVNLLIVPVSLLAHLVLPCQGLWVGVLVVSYRDSE